MWHVYLYLCVYVCIYLCIMEYYSAITKNEILPFGTTWINLGGIMLSEINQTKKDKFSVISLISGIKKKKKTKNTWSHRNRVDWWLSGTGGGGDGEMCVKGCKFPVISSETLIDSLLYVLTILYCKLEIY